jgi:hypothetical protein
LQVNVCCLRNKLLQLEYLCREKNIDLICISEHWLNQNQIDLFVPENFIPASVVCRKLRKNGGVGIYVKNSIQFSVVNVSQFNFELDFEICCIQLIEEDVLIVSIYRSPNGDINRFFDCFERAVKDLLINNHRVIIAGDFNIEMSNNNNNNLTFLRFSYILRSLNLFITNNQPTRLNSCIDNIIVNFNKSLYNTTLGKHCFADHIPLLFEMFSTKHPQKNLNRLCTGTTFVRKQNDDNLVLFISCLKKENWEMIDDFKQNKIDAKTLFNSFFKKFVDLWHYCSPLVKKSSKPRSNNTKIVNWYTPELAKTRNEMLTLFTIYKNFNLRGSEQTQAAYNVYIQHKRKYRKDLTLAKKCAVEQYISNAPNQCRAAWKVISSEHSPTHSQDVNLDPDEFNLYFINSIKELNEEILSSPFSPDDFLGERLIDQNSFAWQRVSAEDVIKAVLKFSNSKAMDFYWLSNYIIKNTIEFISKPLAFVLNHCMNEGYFAPSLKVSKVTPIFKKGDKNFVNNYRPISIVPIFSKIFESIMYNQLSGYFESHNLISDSQYGFRQGKNTTSAVLNIIDHSLEAFERKDSVSLVLCDLSKAFDSVPFDILIQKLSFYGVSDSSLKLIKSYLSNRLQYVSIKNKCSRMKTVETGVPQGSILGPFFFIIYINDLPKNINVNSVIYADDTTLLAMHQNLNYLTEITQQAEKSAYEWFSSNKLSCNTEKTQYLTLSLKQEIDFKSVKLLGINIDSKLNWSIHVETVCKKICRVNYLLWKLKNFVSPEYLRLAYFGLFQSHILYGLLAWGHSPHINDILLIQKKAMRNIAGADPLAHCRPLFVEFKIPTVVNLYILQVLMYTKTNLASFPMRMDIHSHNTRGRGKIDIQQHRLAKTGNSLKLNCIRFFNKLPDSAKYVNFKVFKNKLYNWLVLNPFYSLDEFLNCDVTVIF